MIFEMKFRNPPLDVFQQAARRAEFVRMTSIIVSRRQQKAESVTRHRVLNSSHEFRNFAQGLTERLVSKREVQTAESIRMQHAPPKILSAKCTVFIDRAARGFRVRRNADKTRVLSVMLAKSIKIGCLRAPDGDRSNRFGHRAYQPLVVPQ